MPINQFTAFYPSRPFWAGSKVDFSDQSRVGWFTDQMVQEVFSKECETHVLKVCRDGKVMLRVESLEVEEHSLAPGAGDAMVKRWGDYLDYLNAFYLLLDSTTIELLNFSYFNLHEITTRDAFRVRYEGGRSIAEGIAVESVASIFQQGRYLASYSQEMPVEFDSRITARAVIPLTVIEHTFDLFSKVVAAPGLGKTLASFAKSLSEYKVGNYETSVVLAWFITEAALSRLWKQHIDGLNNAFPDGSKRINRDRRDLLTGRDFTISMVSNLLELWSVLPYDQFQAIDTVRGFRNKIVHSAEFTPRAEEARLAMDVARLMIERIWGISFTPSFTYVVNWL